MAAASIGPTGLHAEFHLQNCVSTCEEQPDPEGVASPGQLVCVQTTTSRNRINYRDVERDFVCRGKSCLTSLPAGFRAGG